MVNLRPYQITARDSVLAEWHKGILSTMIAMATGTGKTETFLSVLAAEKQNGNLNRALILAHRKELIDQPRDRIIRNWSDALPIPGVVMAQQNDADAQIVVATVQTLQSEQRLSQTLSHGVFSHLVIDECHHATADSYVNLVRTLKENNPNLRILGATATPKRTDRDGLRKVFQSVAHKISIKEAIVKLKCLSPFVALAVRLPVDISDVPTGVDGDYNEEKLGTVLMMDNAQDLVVETWIKHAAARQTMVFTASVAQARGLALAFNNAGVSAGWASGQTSKAERQIVVDRYRAGELRVLVNCALWTEGVDIPETSCVAMVRPTKSDTVYIQAVGRGLRLAPGKTDCLILDYVPLGGRDLVMAGDLLGKPKEQRKAETVAREDGLISEAFGIASDGTGIDGDPDDVIVQALNLFAKQSDLRWTFDGRVSTVSVGEKLSLAIISPQKERIIKATEMRDAGQWRVDFDDLYRQITGYQVCVINGAVERLHIADDWQSALDVAEEYVEEHGDAVLAKKTKRWRNEPATDKQVALASRLGIYRDGASKGEVAQAITHKFAVDSLVHSGILR